mgnify:CR=1 FL=1
MLKMDKKILGIIAVLALVVAAYIILDGSVGGGLFPCGDGICDITEDFESCPEDCGTEADVCGNGRCESYESPDNCQFDCERGFQPGYECVDDSDCELSYRTVQNICWEGSCIYPTRLPPNSS